MDFVEYERTVAKTLIPPKTITPIEMWFKGMVEEVGEIAGKQKRIHRDGNGHMYHDEAKKIANECGDLLYYLTCFVGELGYTLGEVAALNMEKVLDRQARGVLQGDGDER